MSGYLEGDEIDAFLKDMLQQGGHNLNPQRIADYKSFMVQFFLQIKTESTRTLSNFDFQWTNILYQNNSKHILHSFLHFSRAKHVINYLQ